VTELLRKLNYKAQDPALILGAPASFAPELEALRSGCDLHESQRAGLRYGFAIAFAPMKADALAAEEILREATSDGAVIWFAFPKQSSASMKSDLNRDRLWEVLAPLGWQPNRNVSIDADWSALRFRRTR